MISKLRFRHLFGDLQQQKYEGVQPNTVTCEASLIKGNGKYFGFAWKSSGGGSLAILKTDEPCKLDPAFKTRISGHQGPVLDFDWYPFDENQLITACEDSYLRLWSIPDQFDDELAEPLVQLAGHEKKCTLCAWHPTSSYVLGSGSFDNTVRVWNVQKPDQAALCYTGPDCPLSLDWNTNGSLLGTTWKDKHLRVIDPRNNLAVHDVQSHDGPKSQKFCWLGDTGYAITCGFSKDFQRQINLWDLKNMEKPVKQHNLDSSAGVIFPTYDADSGVLYLCGKGDGNIRFFEFCEGDIYFTSQYGSKESGIGYGFIPKNSVDVSKHELMRCLKLTSHSVESISMVAPRKSEQFQADLFPDCNSEEPAQEGDDWFAGKDVDPKKRSMKPDPSSPVKHKSGQGFKVQSEAAELKEKVAELELILKNKDAEIEELKKQLAEK